MNREKRKGDRGEAWAANALKERGCVILDRQWRCRYGEIDLVARTPEGVLCFVEVKLRGPDAVSLPREAVDGRKQERLRKAAAWYLLSHDLDDPPARFDVAEVYLDGGDRLSRLEYLEDAFA